MFLLLPKAKAVIGTFANTIGQPSRHNLLNLVCLNLRKSLLYPGARHEAKKDFDLVKFFYCLILVKIMYEIDVSKLVLLSDPPFDQKSRIQRYKMVNKWKQMLCLQRYSAKKMLSETSLSVSGWPRSRLTRQPACSHLTLSAYSDFSDPSFWISGQMLGRRVKPIYRHQFHVHHLNNFGQKRFFTISTCFFSLMAPPFNIPRFLAQVRQHEWQKINEDWGLSRDASALTFPFVF